MSQIDRQFQQLRAEGRKALMPFITAGDPDLATTSQLLVELAGAGASVVELGIPYSDPIADGPVIQASYTRALARHVTLPAIFDQVSQTTAKLGIPVVVMVSYAIVLRHGPQAFVQHAQQAGIAGAIVPDLLVDESDDFARLCRHADFSLIQLVTPTTPRDRAVRIAERSSGFIYFVAVTGITGERRSLAPELVENVAWLRERTDLPICVGFGISQPEHVRALRDVADGMIVGSALVRRIAEASQQGSAEVVRQAGSLVRELVAALD